MIKLSVKWQRDIIDMNELALALTEDVARVGVDKCGKQLKGIVQQFAPRGKTGQLARSIDYRTEVYPQQHRVVAIVGPRARSAGSRKAHLVEFGHIAVAPRKGKTIKKGTAKSITYVAARPFMRPAVETYGAYIATPLASATEQALDVKLSRMRKKKTETVVL
jgi:hypothetical protein